MESALLGNLSREDILKVTEDAAALAGSRCRDNLSFFFAHQSSVFLRPGITE